MNLSPSSSPTAGTEITGHLNECLLRASDAVAEHNADVALPLLIEVAQALVDQTGSAAPMPRRSGEIPDPSTITKTC